MGHDLPEASIPSRSGRRGRAVIVGIAKTAEDGHVRMTRGDGFRLVGGSEPIHKTMQDRAMRMMEELRRRGIRLESMTREEADELADYVSDCK